ncbi:MAG: VanW family protein [Anaerolineae bacterium]|nr:VanW family protein [Anaerolineae bacterium]
MRRVLLALTFFLGLAVASYFVVYRDRVYLGVHAAGYDLGGLTRAQAADLLRRQAQPSLAVRTITLRAGARFWAPTYTDLGARLDPVATAEGAYGVGREQPLAFLRALGLMVSPIALPPVVLMDASAFNAYLARLTAETMVNPQNASVAVAGTTTYAVPAQAGRHLDIPTLVAQLQTILRQGATAAIELPFTEALPQVTDSNEAAQQAARLVGAPLTLAYADKAWSLSPADLQAMLVYALDEAGRLTVSLDKTRLQAWAARLSPEIDRPAQDARLRWDGATNRPVVVQPGQVGLALDVFASTDRLLDAARSSLASSGLPTSERRVEAVVKRRTPAVDESQLDRLGIRELIWEETSLFQGSEPGRVRNIQLAAARFDGVVIPPQAVFSFNDTVGEVSAATGYDQTLIILDNQTVRGAGGGVCQVSTTVFRAAFWTGLPFVERYAHAYRVSYYEQGGKPLGLEAAIFTPDVDLRFKNDTGAAILVHTVVNPTNASLTVRFYGTKPQREVSLDGPRILKRVPAGPPVYQDDPTLPLGQQKQVEVAREGMDVELFRVIKQGGQVVSRERFLSEYVPTQATFKVGKKTS